MDKVHDKIHIREVLHYVWNVPGEYRLSFWTAAKELRKDVLVRKGGKLNKPISKSTGVGRQSAKAMHNLLLHDLVQGHDFEVRISRCVGFDGKQIVHWT
jgi:hypothetical protein